MRKLSQHFIKDLKSGFLSELLLKIKLDKDLDLQIRKDYLNIYFKGNSLLKLDDCSGRYRIDVHPKFTDKITLPLYLTNDVSTKQFVVNIPFIKENIIKCGLSSLETEYEQLIIRANNLEPRNNSEYYILDRQYSIGKDRFDLTGFFWDRNRRSKNQAVPLCFMEIKFGLNGDIQKIHSQISRYYEAINNNVENIAVENQNILFQKLELGLFNQTPDRIDAIKTLKISNDINKYQFILILVDYNPYSKHLHLNKLEELPFSKQVQIFYSGFAIWQKNLKILEGDDKIQ